MTRDPAGLVDQRFSSAIGVAATMSLVLFLAGCSAFPVVSTSAPEIARGHALAEQHCSTCHAIGPNGDSPAEAAPAFREIRDRFDAHSLNGMISQGVSFTHPRMPAFELSDQEAQSLAAYLRSVQDAHHFGHAR